MKPRAARNISLLLILALVLLIVVYETLLRPLHIPVVNVLIIITGAALYVAHNVILHKYYRCTHCGNSLTFGRKISLYGTCPYCKSEIE